MDRMGYAQTFRNPPTSTSVGKDPVARIWRQRSPISVSIRYTVEAPRCSEIQVTENSTIRAPCAFLTVEHRQSLGGLESATLLVDCEC